MKQVKMIQMISIFSALLLISTVLVFQNCSKFNSLGSTENLSSLTSLSQKSPGSGILPGEFSISNSNLGAAATPNQDLQYFGYPMPILDGAIVDEIQGHSNALSIIFDPEKLNEANFRAVVERTTSNLKLIVFIDGAFYSKSTGLIHPGAVVTQNLAKLKSLFQGYENNILALGFDEPIWNRQYWDCGGAWNACVEQVLNQGPRANVVISTLQFLESSAEQIRFTFPGVSLIDIEGGPMIRPAPSFPKNFDFYGFDCYTNFNSCWGRPIPFIYAELKKQIMQLNLSYGGFRRLAVIPEASMAVDRLSSQVGQGLNAKNEAEIMDLFEHYTQMVKDDPMVVIMGVWIWQSFEENSVMYLGSHNFPRLRDHLEKFGQNLTGKPERVHSGPPIVSLLVSSNVRIGERAVWSWASTGANNCRSLTEPTTYPNLESGGFFMGPIETAARSLDYTIECTGAGGSTRKTVHYAVTDPNVITLQPPKISWLPNSFYIEKNSNFNSVKPVNSGGAFSNCSVSPALPAGFTFNTSTCALAGTPTQTQSLQTYVTRAQNAAGFSESQFQLQVIDPAQSVVYCEPITRSFYSAANSIGVRNTCSAQLTRSSASATLRITGSITSGAGSWVGLCNSTGQFSELSSYCQPPADPVPVVPAQFSCTVTQPYLQSFSLSGMVIPASNHFGQHGYYFAAGYDPNGGAWYSFDGTNFVKHDSLGSHFNAIFGIEVLNSTGVSGVIFNHENLTPFPNGKIYVGYGVGPDKATAWDNMISNASYKLCHTLPAAPTPCIDFAGNPIRDCVPGGP